MLFVVGNFDKVKVKKLVQHYFSKVKSKKKQPILFSKPVLQTSKRISMKAPHPKDSLNTILFYWAVPEWTLKDDAALSLLAAHLNNVFKSKNGLPLSEVSSQANTDMHRVAGQFYIETKFLDRKDSTQIHKFIVDKIEKLIKKRISPEDLIRAKKSEISAIVEAQKSLGFGSSRTELLGKGLLFKDNPDLYFEKLRIQQKLKVNQLRTFSKKWLNTTPFTIIFTSNN